MAYTNKTPGYNLPQWEASDKPDRMDFNDAFKEIDGVLEKKVEKDTNGWIKIEAINGATSNSAACRKQGDFVSLCGTFNNISEGMIVGVLPEDYRPKKLGRSFLAPANTVTVVPQFITVNTDGSIRIHKISGSTSVIVDGASYLI